MRVIDTHRSALDRQISEAVCISNTLDDQLQPETSEMYTVFDLNYDDAFDLNDDDDFQ